MLWRCPLIGSIDPHINSAKKRNVTFSKIIRTNPNNFTDLHCKGFKHCFPCFGTSDRYIRTSHLRDRYRMATITARDTPGMHNLSISAQTVRNRLREAGLGACRPVVRQVLTRHHRQQRRLWAQTHHHWTRQDWKKVIFTDESRFCLTRGDGRIRVQRRRTERYTEACTLERD
jgi:hypothetical protein